MTSDVVFDLCVVSHNTRVKLKRLLDCLTADNDGCWNIKVQDNDSVDGSRELLASRPEVSETLLYPNIGSRYGAACNRLAAMGTAPYIGLLNGDVWLSTGDLRALEATFEETGAAIVGPKQRDERNRVRHGGIFGTEDSPTFANRWGVQDIKDIRYREREEALTVAGSAYFIRRDVWNELTKDDLYQTFTNGAVGAFLPTPFYYEETWCSYFARHKGYTVLYDGTVSIGHSWAASTPHGNSVLMKWKEESHKMFSEICDLYGIKHD